ncbi:MAG: hypothetical protein RRY73_01105 [Alistipes sp.]
MIANQPIKRLLCLIALLVALLISRSATAQYYTWGSDPAGLKWSAIRTPDVRIIYPDTATGIARRTLFYVDKIKPYIGYGFRHSAMRIPFVMHPENFQSNGLVMWLPKRVEFLTSPAIDGYSMPWYKQLTAHEYRHAVQYNNLNRGVIRALSYVLGQQGSTIGLLLLPLWLMEGDAVMSETEMSSFGRGLQPRFTLEYRAMGRTYRQHRNLDKWFCGSYREFIPDHYQLGYQIASYAYSHFDTNIWDKVAWYGSRNPYFIFTTSIALKKFYKTNVDRLFHETFDDLNRHWDSLPQVANSATPIVTLPAKNYTSYSHPVAIDSTSAIVVKSDLDRPARLVRVNTDTGEEQKIAYIGALSTRPATAAGRLYWTEYRRSLLFEQRVNSQLCYADLTDGKPHTVAHARNSLYPTPISKDTIAWVEYAPDGRYTVLFQQGKTKVRYNTPYLLELHGLAWEQQTQRLYFLATDDSGMWLGAFDHQGKMEQLTNGAYITLSDLRAHDGKLYFGSIASGKDEVHCFDLATRQEFRISTSTYGSFAPAPVGEKVLMTTYERAGYALSQQDSVQLIPVAHRRLPINLVNPMRKRWNVINLDTVSYTPTDSLHSLKVHKRHHYHKGFTLFNAHSWMPVAFNPFDAVDEQNVQLNWGATVMSQNLLSNAEGFISYGWNRSEKSLVRAGFRYFGLGVHFDLEGAYGGNQLIYSLRQGGEVQKRPDPNKYYSIGLTATLPLLFQRGYHTRQLNLSAGWNFSNGLVANVGSIHYDPHTNSITNLAYIGYQHGLHKIATGISFSDYVRRSTRDLLPRWGYFTAVDYAFNPSNKAFSDQISIYGKVYLPGFLRHDSFSIAATYQASIGGFKTPDGWAMLTYKSTRLLPRGFASEDIQIDNYLATSVNYRFPLCYPEGGIPSVIYFKRIQLNLGADYAQFGHRGFGSHTQRIYSFGGDLTFDVNVFQQPAAATSTITLSLYFPNKGGAFFSVGVGLPF